MASKMMPRKIVTKVTKPSTPCDPSAQTAELQTKVKKLQADLDAERTKVKQLRREKNLECRQIREQEQNSARIALKDLKSKFTVAKQRELEIQKETLNRRYEAELVKIRKQKDGEIAKLRSNLRKCQNELTEAIHCLANSAQHRGLSGAARASSTFESERAKLLAEVQELTNSKRHVDEVVKTLTESERHKTHTIKVLEERLKTDVEKFKKEADIEAKRLLDELKSKDRHIAQQEKDISVRDGQITKLRHEAEANMEQTKRNNELMRRFAPKGLYVKADSLKADSLSSLDSSSSDSGADLNGPPTENEHQVQQLQDQIRNLKDHNNQLTSKLRDSEDKQKPLHEKARKFLEKNMEQTALNRDLEDRIKVLTASNNKLKTEIEQNVKENKRLSEELGKDKTDRTLIKELEGHIDELRSEFADQEEVILALQHACSEKDRRLELLSHRKRKQRNSRSQQKVVRFLLPDEVQLLAAGIKETYYGYDEDRASVDSEGSSRVSLDNTLDDDIFDELSKEECEKNYQRLAREHLELERSYALLQNQSPLSPTEDNQFKESGWTDDEKLGLEKTVHKLQQRLKEKTEELKDTLEQHEDLEFQLLELQEAHDKLLQESEETKSELSFHLEENEATSPRETPGSLEAKNEEMRKKIHKLQRSASKEATTEERALLLQARILLDVSDKKIKELVTNEETLSSRLKKLDEERVTLLSQSAGEPEQLVLEYEQIRNELRALKQENEKLKETNIILESQNQDLSDQAEDWAIVNKMDVPEKTEGVDTPVSQLLEEEMKALKYGELQLTEQNTRLSKELSKVRRELDSTRDELIAANLEITKAAELKEQNLKLTQELSAVKDELKSSQEKLSTASVDSSMQSRATRLSLDDDLVEDNQRLRAEIFSLQEQLKTYESQSPTLSDSTDITSPEHRIKVLEKEIADLKHHNENLKGKLKEREKDVLKSREVVVSIETDLTDLEKENDELRNKLDDLETEDDNEVAALRVKVRALERSARMLQEQLETTGGDVSTSIEDVLEELEQEKDKVAELRKHMDRMAEDLVDLEGLKGQVAELESVRHELNAKLAKLQHLKDLAEGDAEIVTDKEVAAVRSPRASQRSVTSESSDEDQIDVHAALRMVKNQNRSLVVKLDEVEAKLAKAEQNTSDLGDTEKDRRIKVLENELARIHANEDTLNETIEELREVENELRNQVSKNEDSSSDSDKSEEKLEALQLDLTKLHDTNSGLLSQIAEMTESERSLREQLSNTEDFFKAQLSELQNKLAEKEKDSSDDESDRPSADESGDNKSNKSKMAKLEARLKELAESEGDLMEQVYSMKLENQELQEHIELLEAAQDSPRSSEGDSPRETKSESKGDIIDDLKSKINDLEEEIARLKDELLKAKLESAGTLKDDEPQFDAAELKKLQDKINELQKSEKHLKDKVDELETSEQSLKVEIIRIREFEAMAKEHELCEKKVRGVAERLKEFEDKAKDMDELEKELKDLRNQKIEFDKERDVVVASMVGPLGSARKTSRSSESESDRDDDNVKTLSLKVKELESEVERLGTFEVKSKDLEENENKLKDEVEKLENQTKELEKLKNEVQRLKKYEVVYSTERAEVEIEHKDEGQIELEPDQVLTERLERELTDDQPDRVHVAIEKETVLAAVNVGSMDRKRRSPRSSESDLEEVKELTQQIKELESQLEQIPELRSQLDKMKEHNESLVENMTKMKLHIDDMEAEERELHEQLRKRSGLQAQLHEMEAQFAAQNEQLVAYHKAVEAEKNKIKGERDELKASLVMAKEDSSEAIAKLEKFNKEYEEMKAENDQLKAEKEDFATQLEDLNEIVALSDQLREQNTSLQSEFDELNAKLDDTVIEKENLEKSEKELKERAQKLEEQLKSKSDTEVKLFEKIGLLVESEGRLAEKLEETEEEEDLLREEVDKLKEENDKLRRQGTSSEEANSEIGDKLEQYEKKERDLKEQITVLETKKEDLEDKLKASKNSGDEELVKLREKVDILLDTEEKLMDRLQEQEEVEAKLREKLEQLEEKEKELRVQLVTTKEQDLRSRSSSKSSADSESSTSQDEINELKQNEKVMKQRINELEKSEAVLSTDLRGLEKTLETLAKSETDMRDRLQESQTERRLLQLKYDELSKMELALHSKVGDLEDQNQNLIHSIQEPNKDFVSSSEEERIVPQSVVSIAAAPSGGRRRRHQLATSSASSLEDQIVADVSPGESDLHDLSKDELIARLQESEEAEEYHREKVRELSEDLSQFRQAVGVVAGEPERSEGAHARRKRPKSNYSDDYAEERDSGLESLQLSASFSMLDSPEAILKQRIAECEKMEQHHKQQINELENDREELHEIARHDKNHIHELSVQNREYELSEKNLKDQVNRLEASESQLQLQVDDLTDRIEDLEEQIKNMKLVERQLRAALVKTENKESELSTQLENVQDDVEHAEKQWKKKVSEMEGDKVNFANKVEELTLRVSDLEGSELTLKRKLKKAEDANEANKQKAAELEESENDALFRIRELEAANEALSQKLHKLEEEKASLLYELSDLETTHIDGHDTVHKLKASQRKLLEDLASREGAGSLMQKKLKEYMERENEFEEELEKYQKLEKQWNEKREKMDTKIDSLSAKVQELEALIASNETKVSFVNDLEKENAILHRNIAHQQKTIQQSDQEIHKLQDKLMQFEYSSANNALATLPKDELAELRSKAKQLEIAAEKIDKLEKLEIHLRECIEKLREGKDAHGYELEIAEMKEKVNKYNQLVKAHELLKENHEHAKKELKALREQLQKKGVELPEDIRPESSNKGILARLTHSFTLSDITPELKQALKQLESNHPAAYDEFVRTLHPGAGSMAVIKPSQDVEAKMKFSDEEASTNEEQIQPVSATSVSASKPTDSEETKRQGTKHQVYGRLVQPEKEENVWSAIEGPATRDGRPIDEDNLWTNIEQPKEDLTLTVVLGDEDSDVAGKSKTSSVLSVGSSGSSRPPPLPETVPPELAMRRLDSPGNDSSYYLPSAHESMISADEASDIDEDEVTGLRSQSRTPPRAKSVDRDSVISESLLSASPGKRLASSMDSIPDSGMGTLHQSEREILKEKIGLLEKQLKAKEKELNLVQINQRELDAEDTSRTMVELQDKIQRLQEDVKLKDAELNSLQTAAKDKGTEDLSELEFNINSLKFQLEKKEQEITEKNNSLDSMKEELKKYQDDASTLREDKKSLEKALNEIGNNADGNKDLEEKYSELQTDFIDLQREYNELEDRLAKTDDSEQNMEELEETVMKLRGQLSDFESLNLEREDLQSKLNAVEEEFKSTKSQNNDLVRDNASLLHKVDQLTRDNNALQVNSADFNKVKSKYLTAEKRKTQAENMITPLRARVIKLSKTCKDKDNLIEKLAKEVRKVNKKSGVVLEADQMISRSASEDYNRPLTPLSVPSSDEEEIVLGDMPPLVSASVLHSGTDSNNYVSGVSGAPQKPKASINQIEALIEPRVSNGTQMAPSMSNGSAHPSTGNVTIDDLVIAPQASLAPVNQVSEDGAHTLPKQKKRSKEDAMYISRTTSSTEHYRAVKDYSPEHFSRSGHRRLELPLKEGDIVKVLGEIVTVGCRLVLQYMIRPGIFAQCSTDDKGYFEAEIDGKVGLVPANYLQPVYPARPHRPKSDIYGDKAPEQILSMHADLQRAHVPVHKVSHISSAIDDDPEETRSGSSSARSSTREGGSSITHPMFLGAPVMPMTRKPNSNKRAKPKSAAPQSYIKHPGHHNKMNGYPLEIATSLPSLSTTSAPTSVTSEANQPQSSKLSGHPAPPVALQLQCVVGRHSLLLAWRTPVMDELAHSNGVQVTGYRLQVDGRDKQDLPSPHLTKALVEHLNLHKPHNFTLQTVSSTGAASRPVYTSYEGPGKHRGEEEGDSAGDGDVSSIMSGSHNGTGDHDRRVFMAIYNYHPQKQSPKSDPSDELPLTAGDIITTYGPARSDGFYHAKVKGRKGLVPANFVEEIALFRSGSHRSLVSGTGAPVAHPMSAGGSRPSSSGTKQTKLRS